MKEKVLIVEDDFSNSIAALAAMDELGYDAVVATTAKDGIEMIKKEEFFGVLTDMNMPLKQKESVNPKAGEVVVKECLKRAVPVAIVTGGGTGHHGVPCIKVLISKQITIMTSDQQLSFDDQEIDGKDKDIMIWKRAWRILEDHAKPEEIFRARKRHRKYVGRGFEFKE